MGFLGYATQRSRAFVDRWLDRHEWHVVSRYRRVTLVDGTLSSETYLWGRKINGVWSYRPLTNEEYNLHIADMAV